MTPLVSIIIPVYNPGPLLDATIQSALAQTWPNLEIVVVDDGSTDDSLARARSYADPRLRIIAQANAGSCAARNTGVRHARGDWLQFLDHDDLLSPDKIARQLALYPNAPERTLLMGEITRFYDDAEGVRHEIPPGPDYRPAWGESYPRYHRQPARDWLRHWWSARLETTPLAWLVPRTLAIAAGPWEERYLSRLDDFEYITRLLLAADRLVLTPDARSWFRTLVAGSMSSTGQNRSRRAHEGQAFAINLCCDHVLAAEDTPRTRRAAAGLLMDFAYAAYPAHPGPALAAEARARALNTPLPPCPGGRLTQRLSSVLGWRLAKRLQHFAIQCGYSRS